MADEFKDWWTQHKTSVNLKRKKKYHEDPERRERLKANARDYYDRVKRRTTPVDRRTVMGDDGMKYYSIGRLARMIGRRPGSIRRYHLMQVIPEPTHYDRRGWRLYTGQQAGAVQFAFQKYDAGDPEFKTLRMIKDFLASKWSE